MNNRIFHKKTIAPPPQESNGRPLYMVDTDDTRRTCTMDGNDKYYLIIYLIQVLYPAKIIIICLKIHFPFFLPLLVTRHAGSSMHICNHLTSTVG